MILTPAVGGAGSLRRAVAAVLIALAPVACASNNIGGSSPAVGAPVTPGQSLSGNYLAARHASTVRNDPAAAEFLLATLTKAPDDPVLLERTYVVLIVDGRVDEATALARRLLKQDDDSSLTHLVVAIDDIHSGRLEEAEKHLDTMPASRMTGLLKPMFQAWTLYGLGRSPDAVLAALEPLKRQPGVNVLYQLHAALLNDALGRTAAAETHARAAVETQGGLSLRLVDLVGGIFERAGKPEEARALYIRFLADNDDPRLLPAQLARLDAGIAPPPDIATAADGVAEALFDTAGAFARQNTRETAVILGRLGLYLKPDFPELQMLVADTLESLDRREQANEVYASVDPTSPFSRRARLASAVNLNRLGRTDEAIAELRAMAKEYPNDPDPLIDLGDIYRGHERFAEAVEAYDEGVARLGTLEARDWRLLYARGIALERSKNWPRAEADLLKALEFEPEQPFVLNYLGYSWVDQGLNLDQALAMIQKAVDLRPNDGYIVDSLGWALYRLKRYDEAVRELERAVELQPEDPVINDHLGDAYWAVGRDREARYQWRTVLDLKPEADLREKIEIKLQRGPVPQANAALHD